MSKALFLSRDKNYKSHHGAAPSGTRIHFRICLPRDLSCSGAILVVQDDLANLDSFAGLFWCGLDSNPDYEWWECHYTFEKTSLYFYYFMINTPRGEKFLYRGWGSVAELHDSPLEDARWQQTVYSTGFKTPEWLSGGLIYQIFPDSFCQSHNDINENNIPYGRVIQSWDGLPHWQPDKNGKILNDHYYGGNLAGIIEKIPYLKRLGVTCIYLNPIFEAHENHRYNTANYEKIDPMLGNEDTFRKLCRDAKKHGMRIILDGVFSHTGDDSIYFNKRGRYNSVGAYNSPESPYYDWYTFQSWPDKYSSWWGIITLPELHETCPGVLEYFNGQDGITGKWIGKGALGWRLDVADELPDEFLDSLRISVKSADEDAVIIGEVWEDASNKCAYGKRRRYFLGGQLDTVMNYPFKDAILAYLTGADGAVLMETVQTILENYPPQVVSLLMNLIGSHDTARAINILGGADDSGHDRAWKAFHPINHKQYELGRSRLKLAALLQYTLPSVPSLYYGDEVGVTGYGDPFNRSAFPWPPENKDNDKNHADNVPINNASPNRDYALLDYYRNLGGIRRDVHCLKSGEFIPGHTAGRIISYIRKDDIDKIFVAVNAGDQSAEIPRPAGFDKGFPLLREDSCLQKYTCTDNSFCIPAGGYLVYYCRK